MVVGENPRTEDMDVNSTKREEAHQHALRRPADELETLIPP